MSEKAMDLLNNKKLLSVACIALVFAVGGALHFLGFGVSKIVGFSGIVFGAFSAFWFSKGLLLSDEEIDAITSITKSEKTSNGGYEVKISKQNKKARDSLKDNRENAKIGIIFLLLAFMSQSLGHLIM